MSEQRFGAGGIPLRPIVEDTPEEPEVVEEAPVVKYTTTTIETESEELPTEVVEDDTEIFEVGSKE